MPQLTPSAASPWTRIGDGGRGESSLSNFDILYVEGSAYEAGVFLYQVFGLPPNLATRQQACVFSFESFESFERASLRDRGALDALAWRQACETDVERAREQGDGPVREGAALAVGRADLLAACLPDWNDGVVRDQRLAGRIEAGQELLSLSRSMGPRWMDKSNLSLRAGALARLIELGLRSMSPDPSEREKARAAPWAALGETLRPTDLGWALRSCIRSGERDKLGRLVATLARAAKAGHPEAVVAMVQSCEGDDLDAIARASEIAALDLAANDPRRQALIAFAAELDARAIGESARLASAGPRARL